MKKENSLKEYMQKEDSLLAVIRQRVGALVASTGFRPTAATGLEELHSECEPVPPAEDEARVLPRIGAVSVPGINAGRVQQQQQQQQQQ